MARNTSAMKRGFNYDKPNSRMDVMVDGLEAIRLTPSTTGVDVRLLGDTPASYYIDFDASAHTLTFTGIGLNIDIDSTIELGAWPESTSAPTTSGIHVGTTKTRAVVVAANDGGADPTRRIESSCHTLLQGVDWATGWSATALEGAFYGGFDLIATEDNMNVSGAGGWIYLNDESGYSTVYIYI